jgi:hypothetical protein
MRGTEASPRIASWISKWLHGTLYITIRSSAVGTYSPAGIAGIAAVRGISMLLITRRLDAPRERPRARAAVVIGDARLFAAREQCERATRAVPREVDPRSTRFRTESGW